MKIFTALLEHLVQNNFFALIKKIYLQTLFWNTHNYLGTPGPLGTPVTFRDPQDYFGTPRTIWGQRTYLGPPEFILNPRDVFGTLNNLGPLGLIWDPLDYLYTYIYIYFMYPAAAHCSPNAKSVQTDGQTGRQTDL